MQQEGDDENQSTPVAEAPSTENPAGVDATNQGSDATNDRTLDDVMDIFIKHWRNSTKSGKRIPT